MPKVTVAIPSYNHGRFIGEAIGSVLAQNFQDFELIIVDDCSTDNSVEIITTFKDPRIKLIVNKQNMGACYGHNLMIQLAQGEYIALINSDDVWHHSKLEKQVLFLDKSPQHGAVFTDAQPIQENGDNVHNADHFYSSVFSQPNRNRAEWLRHFFYNGNCLCHPSILIRKSVYLEIGDYNPLLALVPDFEMWIRVCSNYCIHILQEKLIRFRLLDNENNASGANLKNFVRGHFEQGKALDAFCKIAEPNLFNEAFPNYKASTKEEISFQFTMMCINDRRPYIKNYGLNKLYELLHNNYALYNQYITDKEFLQLVLEIDVFNIANLENGKFRFFWTGEKNAHFNDTESLELPVTVLSKKFTFRLPFGGKLTKFRLSPLNKACKVKIKTIKLSDTQNNFFNAHISEHNAHYIDDDGYYVAYHNDLQLLFNAPNTMHSEATYNIVIECDILGIHKNECLDYISILTNKITSQQNINLKQLLKQKIKNQLYKLLPWK